MLPVSKLLNFPKGRNYLKRTKKRPWVAYIFNNQLNTGLINGLKCPCQVLPLIIYRKDPYACEPCNCNGHSDKCHYDEEVDNKNKSLDIHGNMEGGGVCEECQHFTDGINCETCKFGYFRPEGVLANATEPCIRKLELQFGQIW